jgi:methionyl-tRNA formyltransferase
MALLGAQLLLETIPRYLSGELIPIPQPEAGATYAPMLKKEDGWLDFSLPAVVLERRVRAMNPWPGAYFDWNGTMVKVHRACLGREKSPGAGGRITFKGWPAVGTGEGVLILEEIQPAGKKSMLGKAFLAGARDWAT